MMEDLWTLFCGESDCSDSEGEPCSFNFLSVAQPSSCLNHALIISLDIFLLSVLLFNMFQKKTLKTRIRGVSPLRIVSATFNGCLGLIYLFFGIWTLEEELRKNHNALPLHSWLVVLFEGFTWLFVGLSLSLKGLRLLSVFTFVFAGVLCVLSLLAAYVTKEVSVKTVLDILSLPGSSLMLLSAYKGFIKHEESDEIIDSNTLYTPLSGEVKSESFGHISLFSKAKFFSVMTFWWLNPLMKMGREKTLEDEDIPKLREKDRAESCYSLFLEKLNEQKQTVLRTIILCYWKEILISGLFALLKVLTLSCGPVLLNLFIEVAEGKETFKNEGYVLALSLFVAKTLESLSQRQWYFQSRLLGLKVRSLLTAAIYRKQLRLSNAAKLMHSSGEIMNYVTVDAYRIGEFPFWFHQTWTTSVQLCIAVAILFRAVGPATIASLVVIILTVLCNTPLAKLQHKFQTKLMVAQDERLKASSEALVNMKVLKLYAWETHFKNVIERLREVEYKWLSAVQLRRAYNSFLFWSSPVLVSAATFGMCYFVGVPLYASNVFTFVATLRLVQDPIRTIPDVIGVVIQAKVAFARIVKFLDAPELHTENVRRKTNTENCSILLKSANLSWEENPLKPTLKDIRLEVKPGEKVAICGEVGSGKSTLLAAILGEVPKIQGTVSISVLFYEHRPLVPYDYFV